LVFGGKLDTVLETVWCWFGWRSFGFLGSGIGGYVVWFGIGLDGGLGLALVERMMKKKWRVNMNMRLA
jgi:hypothetical protein